VPWPRLLSARALCRTKPAAGAIRDHRANAGRGRSVDHGGASETAAVPLSEPRVGIASCVDAAVFPGLSGPWSRRLDWTRGLRHEFIAAHESDSDLLEDQKSADRSAPAWAHEARKSGTSGSRLMMLWRSPSRPRSNLADEPVNAPSGGRLPGHERPYRLVLQSGRSRSRLRETRTS
jgi:hypothetical protein